MGRGAASFKIMACCLCPDACSLRPEVMSKTEVISPFEKGG